MINQNSGLLQALNKYLNENLSYQKKENIDLVSEESDTFFVRSDRKIVKINFSEIQFIESLADYIKIHFQNKTVVTRETISNVETRLPKKSFLRTHRSFIVSLDYIESFTNELVEIGKKQIPISRSYKNEVLNKLAGLNTNISN